MTTIRRAFAAVFLFLTFSCCSAVVSTATRIRGISKSERSLLLQQQRSDSGTFGKPKLPSRKTLYPSNHPTSLSPTVYPTSLVPSLSPSNCDCSSDSILIASLECSNIATEVLCMKLISLHCSWNSNSNQCMVGNTAAPTSSPTYIVDNVEWWLDLVSEINEMQEGSKVVFELTHDLIADRNAITVTGDRNIVINGNGFTISDGGGFVMNPGSSIELNNVCITDWVGGSNGGVVQCKDCNAVMNNNSFDGNTAQTGGVVYASGSRANVEISNCQFTGNTGTSNTAGVLYSKKSATVSISKSTFTGNSAAHCGAVRGDSGSNIVISESIFNSNEATAKSGGALYSSSSTFQVSNSTFTSNNASYHGGAFYSEDSTFKVSNSTFTSNEASLFGGVAFVKQGEINFAENSFISNSASSLIGDILYLHVVQFDSNFVKVTFQNDSFDDDKVIYYGGDQEYYPGGSTSSRIFTIDDSIVTSTDTDSNSVNGYFEATGHW